MLVIQSSENNQEAVRLDGFLLYNSNMKKEEWKPVVGYEGLYEVSSYGKVRSLNFRRTKKCSELAQFNSGGYKMVHLTKNGIMASPKVHRLVAQAFIPNPENKPEVNHENGDKTKNTVDNLSWVTRGENQQHKYQILKISPNRPNRRPVRCKETGAVYDSVRAASRAMKTTHGSIRRAIQMGIRCKSYHWEYIDENN